LVPGTCKEQPDIIYRRRVFRRDKSQLQAADDPEDLEAIDLQVTEKISFREALIVGASRGDGDIRLTEDVFGGRTSGNSRSGTPSRELEAQPILS